MTRAILCPVCDHDGARLFFEVATAPVYQNRLFRSKSDALECARADIRLYFCPLCGFVFNGAFDDGLVTYTADYDNAQCYSEGFRTYLAETANDLVNTYGLRSKTIAEVGCGMGYFLTLICAAGNNTGIGYDPAYVQGSTSDSVKILSEEYSAIHASIPVDFICARHVLEHIRTPQSLISLLRKHVERRAGCKAYVEVPSSTWIFAQTSFWDIYYEHCSYFSACSLSTLLARSGFIVRRMRKLFDGQFLGLEAEAATNGVRPAAVEYLDGGPDRVWEQIETFVRDYPARLGEIQGQLATYFDSGLSCVFWGAGAKAVTLLDRLGVREEHVEFVVDVNPRKHGCFLPTGQAIISPEALRSVRHDVIIVTNPRYLPEIRSAAARLGSRALVTSI